MARVIIECDLFRYRVFICETKPIKSNKVQGSPVFIDGESHAHPDKRAYRDINYYYLQLRREEGLKSILSFLNLDSCNW